MIFLANPFFHYKNNILSIENVNVLDIAKNVGTPVYCYSLNAIKNNYRQFQENLPNNSIVCYAVKSNSNLSILSLLNSLGAGADVVSEGEIRRAIAAGISPNKIVFSGVGKTEQEINFALDNRILQFNVESIEELSLINTIACQKNIIAPVSIRINPNINADTNDKITTGLKVNKFGIPEELLDQIFNKDFTWIKIIGISVHIGSQISNLHIFQNTIDKIKKIIKIFKQHNTQIIRVDLGGGLGIPYKSSDTFPTIQEYANLLKKNFENENYQIICEPGRALVGNTGILLTKVLYRKYNQEKSHIILDAGMNDLIRPALYNAEHTIIPAISSTSTQLQPCDIVGPICESDDTFAHNYHIHNLQNGEIVAICTAGAYGSSMSSNYNSRLLIPEVMVNNSSYDIIRSRQTYEDMLKDEIILEF
ncbi:diaminopimelate decarboxylase [Ehrlichia chaffeensis str. Heartland]|uniref:Diaminopimelate decarboxylase n=1 Tax=Ehrlichia chaffeensis (strain ATCC CRL-10679 / Arkansas) TaxID=205920 RepID=Q2GGY2_EHRCR|nr:diaminopimelate decarboxylase [Ehrlichia chaffeensis]ABD45270.1 diaminopimelate decarboxylase [Ehrlichia chaffeensis str. Arkansas]AHX03582.1 diaminopimelate decarboxylase [Ehrlichia chaffeensis str. Heartland]AHX06688.1 diaminopimelate decarboxylase [Ehrlichia chaffeensis str. Liberty]AHX07682.1 diaminopimelate decarboxylase [Ehrlichia chaffeensis str. Osceola]AHX08350.1 diaminopimelate decarboxylase [Ehrlichia chaffeensis str. Saint Vincent]